MAHRPRASAQNAESKQGIEHRSRNVVSANAAKQEPTELLAFLHALTAEAKARGVEVRTGLTADFVELTLIHGGSATMIAIERENIREFNSFGPNVKQRAASLLNIYLEGRLAKEEQGALARQPEVDKFVAEVMEEFYNRNIVNKAAERTVADKYGMSIVELKQAIALWKATKKETTSREPDRAKAKPRLKWEKDRRDGEDPAHFAARAYAVEMAAGTLHRGLIGQEDKPLAVKLASWLRSNPMPEGVDIPTKPEWNTRQAEATKAEPASLYSTLASRRWRARHRGPAAA